jgi:hypothetical protein
MRSQFSKWVNPNARSPGSRRRRPRRAVNRDTIGTQVNGIYFAGDSLEIVFGNGSVCRDNVA